MEDSRVPSSEVKPDRGTGICGRGNLVPLTADAVILTNVSSVVMSVDEPKWNVGRAVDLLEENVELLEAMLKS